MLSHWKKRNLQPFSISFSYFPSGTWWTNRSSLLLRLSFLELLFPTWFPKTFITPSKFWYDWVLVLSPSLSPHLFLHLWPPFTWAEGAVVPLCLWGQFCQISPSRGLFVSFLLLSVGAGNGGGSVSEPILSHNAPVSITDRPICLFGLLGVNKESKAPWKKVTPHGQWAPPKHVFAPPSDWFFLSFSFLSFCHSFSLCQ